MERYKITTTTVTVNLDTKEINENKRTIFQVVKNWEELTREEKEAEIEKNSESIYQCYQEDLYQNYKFEIENIREKYQNIDFEDIYFDSSSHGSWIDRVKNFSYKDTIDIFGEQVSIYDVDLHTRTYIQEISEEDLYIDFGYYIDAEKEEKIKSTKKYQDFIKDAVKNINNWIEDVNNAAKEMLSNEYCYPYNLDNKEDADYLAGYFYDAEFTFESEEEL